RMGIAGCAHGKLVCSRLGMDRVVLPVSIPVDGHEIVAEGALRPLAELATLEREGEVGVIVGLVGAVGADDRGRADEDSPVRVALDQRPLEPGFLSCAPDGLLRPVGHRVRRSVVAALDEPDLERLAPAERAIRPLAHRYFCPEYLHSLLKRE